MSSSGEHDPRADQVNDDNSNDAVSDHEDNSSEDDEVEDDARMHRNIVLRDFFRLFAGARANGRDTAADNTELVNILKEIHVVRRGTFIPEEYAAEAYVDAPIRVEQMEFNISAPHMHATCLEALDLQPGEKRGNKIVEGKRVGKYGETIAVEIKQSILDFSINCLNKLREDNRPYVRDSCNVQFLLRNAFIPTSHKDYFDKIHVGGTCPEDKLTNLVRMLKPDGGKMTVPVGQELRLITRRLNGIQYRVLTQVRFSELSVPSDADIVLSTMNSEREEKMMVTVPPSTLSEDTKLVRSLSEGHQSTDAMDHDGNGAKKVKRTIGNMLGLKKEESKSMPVEDVCLDLVHFAEPDCTLVGDAWTLSSHRAVLKGDQECLCYGLIVSVVRCEYFRARFESDMQDAEDQELSVPSQFSQESVSYFLQYIYKDELPKVLSAQSIIDVLHVACYYGVPRLVVLCESLLAEALKSHHQEDPDSAADLAASLLTLADSNGLGSLRDVVLQYIVEHFDRVSSTPSYRDLSKREVDLIMQESFTKQQRFKHLLSDLSGEHPH